jgi:hypothetical protein
VDWSSPQPTVGLHLKNGDKLRTKYVIAVGGRVLTKADSTIVNTRASACMACRLLIGADGAQSIVRQTFNFGAVGWQYSQASSHHPRATQLNDHLIHQTD